MLQLIVPNSLKDLVLYQIHANPACGHLGTRKTLGRTRRRFYWVGYRSDILAWCRKCVQCQKRKNPSKKHRAMMKPHIVGIPFERVALDIMGPLPKSHQGNRYILIITGYFTRWLEAFPIPDQEACTIADVLVKGFISRYGVSQQIHSDQGVQFESKVFQNLCTELGIDKTRTTPYHPQSDGLVERFNRTLAEMLSKVVDNDHRNWDERFSGDDGLPFICA